MVIGNFASFLYANGVGMWLMQRTMAQNKGLRHGATPHYK
jgi:hypothetical protein